jgi:hypothetical protein
MRPDTPIVAGGFKELKMPFLSCKSWPLVRVDDDGIRPAGKPDQCFYCQAKVGEPHGAECVCVLQQVTYDVICDNRLVGKFTTHEPYHWDDSNGEFHKVGSSWCASNAFDEIEWSDEAVKSKASQIVEADGDECLCGMLEFTNRCVVHDGPIIELREELTNGR